MIFLSKTTYNILRSFRVLEINGTNVASKSYRETNKLLMHHHQTGNAVKMVVARPLDSVVSNDGSFSLQDGGNTPVDSIEQYQKLNTSLNAKLEFQSAEVDHWKQECERYRPNISCHHTCRITQCHVLYYPNAGLRTTW